MRIIGCDFETYFAKGYSLSEKDTTTESYVRDAKFKAHLVGLKYPNQPAIDILPAMLLDNESLRKDIETSAILCHHAQFDCLILSHHYGLRPAFILDTLSMARLVLRNLKSHSLDALAAHFRLPAKSVPYHLFKGVLALVPELYAQVAAGCRHDLELTDAIFRKLLPYVPKDELRVIDLTVRMFTEPCLALDRPRLETFHAQTVAEKERLMLNVGSVLGAYTLEDVEKVLQSAPQFAAALKAIGYDCPMKPSPTGQGMIPAIAKNDEAMKDLLEHEDPRVQALAAARKGVKSTLNETRAERFLGMAQRGPLTVYLKYAGAGATLRWSAGDGIQYQNLPRGGELRKCLLAPPGYKLVIGDLSQIEYRLLCWLAGQTDKLEALVAGRDLYCEFASSLYGTVVTKEMKKERGVGKQGTLQCGYGAGADSIIRTAASGAYGPPVAMSYGDGLAVRDLYRTTHPAVCARGGLWHTLDHTILPMLHDKREGSYGILDIADGCIWLPNDTWLDYSGLRRAMNHEIFPDQAPDGEAASWWTPSRKGWSRTWGSKVTADIIQGLARVVIVAAALRMLAYPWRLVLTVHDELVYLVPDAEVKKATKILEQELKTPLAWCATIPLACEVSSSERYDK